MRSLIRINTNILIVPSSLFILFCFHPMPQLLCCCFNGGTKRRKKTEAECSILGCRPNNNRFCVGKQLSSVDGQRLTPVKACITTPHIHTCTHAHAHEERRLTCCSEMETGRHNKTGFGSQNKNNELDVALKLNLHN